MNTKIAALMGLIVIVGGGFYVAQRGVPGESMEKNDSMMKGESAMQGGDSMMKKEEAMESDTKMDMKKPETMMKDESMVPSDSVAMADTKAGMYGSYSPEKVAAAQGKVVLFFHASWCPVCRAIDADIQANLGNIPPDLTILKVDFDTAHDLRKKYGVTYQYTFVQVDGRGSELQQWSGNSKLSDIVAKVQ